MQLTSPFSPVLGETENLTQGGPRLPLGHRGVAVAQLTEARRSWTRALFIETDYESDYSVFPTSTPAQSPDGWFQNHTGLCRSGMHASLGSSRLGGPAQLAWGSWLSLVLLFLTSSLWLGTFSHFSNDSTRKFLVLRWWCAAFVQEATVPTSAVSGALGYL